MAFVSRKLGRRELLLAAAALGLGALLTPWALPRVMRRLGIAQPRELIVAPEIDWEEARERFARRDLLEFQSPLTIQRG